ncbi:MAG: Omp28-related outer membrane protein [Bacteroidetes bacterium]|nr:Omp28-related outer membrane protein [Bacteroidota bacterium]
MKSKIGLFLLLGLFLAACSEHKVETDTLGCTDPNSLNYNKDANIDDGSCLKIEKKQYGFIIEYTAAWCVYCGGTNGAVKMHELYKTGNVVAIAAHAANGDPMNNAGLYNSFNSCRPDGGGIPHFWIGDIDDGSSGDLTALKAKTPEAGVVLSSQVVGDSLKVKAVTEFFKALDGDYFLSVYVMEYGIDGYSGGSGDPYFQVGTSDPTYMHDLVLRSANTPSFAYGEQIVTTSVEKDATITKNYSIAIDSQWNMQKVYTVACIWKKNKDTGFFEFVNGYESGNHLSH